MHAVAQVKSIVAMPAARMQFYDEADVTPAYGAGESSSSGRSSSSSSCGSASGTGKCTWRITPHAAHALLRPPLMQRYLRIFWAGDACSQAHHAQMCTAIQAAYRTWQRREAAMSTPKRQRMMGPSAHGGEHFMLAPDTQAKRGM